MNVTNTPPLVAPDTPNDPGCCSSFFSRVWEAVKTFFSYIFPCCFAAQGAAPDLSNLNAGPVPPTVTAPDLSNLNVGPVPPIVPAPDPLDHNAGPVLPTVTVPDPLDLNGTSDRASIILQQIENTELVVLPDNTPANFLDETVVIDIFTQFTINRNLNHWSRAGNPQQQAQNKNQEFVTDLETLQNNLCNKASTALELQGVLVGLKELTDAYNANVQTSQKEPTDLNQCNTSQQLEQVLKNFVELVPFYNDQLRATRVKQQDRTTLAPHRSKGENFTHLLNQVLITGDMGIAFGLLKFSIDFVPDHIDQQFITDTTSLYERIATKFNVPLTETFDLVDQLDLHTYHESVYLWYTLEKAVEANDLGAALGYLQQANTHLSQAVLPLKDKMIPVYKQLTNKFADQLDPKSDYTQILITQFIEINDGIAQKLGINNRQISDQIIIAFLRQQPDRRGFLDTLKANGYLFRGGSSSDSVIECGVWADN